MNVRRLLVIIGFLTTCIVAWSLRKPQPLAFYEIAIDGDAYIAELWPTAVGVDATCNSRARGLTRQAVGDAQLLRQGSPRITLNLNTNEIEYWFGDSLVAGYHVFKYKMRTLKGFK